MHHDLFKKWSIHNHTRVDGGLVGGLADTLVSFHPGQIDEHHELSHTVVKKINVL